VLSLDVYAQFAPSPMGPWGGDRVIFSVPDQGGEGIFSAYMPNICAGTGSNGIYTIGYSDNGAPESWFSKTYSDKSWYNPHFFTANLLAMSPYTLNYAVGGPGSRQAIKFAADQNYNHNYIDNTYGAGALNTTNWVNIGPGGGASGVTNLPYYSFNGQKYVSSARMVFNWAGEITHTVDNAAKSNNVALLESWINVNNNGWYLSVTNLDAPFTNGYSVYFYYHGSTVGYGGQNYLRFYAGSTTTTTLQGIRQWNLYTTVSANNGGFAQDLTPTNTSTAGETFGANYLVFTNLSGGAFDLLITNGNFGGVNGIEIVANTLPTVGPMVVLPATNVYADGTVTLTAATNGGVAPFNIFWQAGGDGVNWTNLMGASTTNLVINHFSPGNAGYYQLVDMAANGSATSAAVRLTYYGNLPAVTPAQAFPSNVVNQGTLFTITCATNDGAPPFGLQWLASNNGLLYTNIPGANSLALNLTSSVAGDYGYRACAYTAAGLTVTSAPVHLQVLPLMPGTIMISPGNPVFIGQSARLVCSNYDGLAPIHYQWQVSATGSNWTNLMGAVTNQLVLLGVSTNQIGYYQCIINAANGAVTSAPVFLNVTAAGNGAPRLAVKFAPDQNYGHCFINQNWTTPATKQPAGVLNTTNWNNWDTSSSAAPYRNNKLFYDVKGVTNGNLSTATLIDYHQGEQCIYYNGSWPAAWFTNNNASLLDSTFWYFGDQVACVITNLDPVFATNGYSVYVYFL
ncbi:MAG TPA: hypothetical protein VF607_10035, partial [Verrucomicrobiae bacterium]